MKGPTGDELRMADSQNCKGSVGSSNLQMSAGKVF